MLKTAQLNNHGCNKNNIEFVKGRRNFIIPYPAVFNKIPAKRTEIPVGASTWASGNQEWKGTTGNLTKKETKNEKNKENWKTGDKFNAKKSVIKSLYIEKNKKRKENKEKIEPNKVKKRNFIEAYMRRTEEPHRAISINIGNTKASKK